MMDALTQKCALASKWCGPADGISVRQLWVISGYPAPKSHPASHYRLRLDALSRDARYDGVPDAFNCIESLNKWRTVYIGSISPESTYEDERLRYHTSATNSMEGSNFDHAQKMNLATYLPVDDTGMPTVCAEEYLTPKTTSDVSMWQ